MSCADVFVVLCRSVSSSVHCRYPGTKFIDQHYQLPPPSVPGRGAEGLFVPCDASFSIELCFPIESTLCFLLKGVLTLLDLAAASLSLSGSRRSGF